jgi:hypothetical protein
LLVVILGIFCCGKAKSDELANDAAILSDTAKELSTKIKANIDSTKKIKDLNDSEQNQIINAIKTLMKPFTKVFCLMSGIAARQEDKNCENEVEQCTEQVDKQKWDIKEANLPQALKSVESTVSEFTECLDIFSSFLNMISQFTCQTSEDEAKTAMSGNLDLFDKLDNCIEKLGINEMEGLMEENMDTEVIPGAEELNEL